MPLPLALKTYLIKGIAGSPLVVSRLAENITDWDVQSEPGRFTFREALAHLTDWDAVFSERIHRILTEDHPVLADIDEAQLAIDRAYASQDPAENLVRFRDSRAALVGHLNAIEDDQWERTGHREKVGDVTLAQLVTMILGHDAYHIQHFAETRANLN
jgi:hypothetical protein